MHDRATAKAGAGVSRTHRQDLLRIAEMIAPGARVLDVGCGDGDLLDLLVHERGIDGRGIEISPDGVRDCMVRGLSVIQGDANTDLADYPDDAFDYAVLSLTLQAMGNPRTVLRELLRIGHRAIVSFPNFGHWSVRLGLLLSGRMPVTRGLPHQWYDTPNIHLCTLRDFAALCDELGITIEQTLVVRGNGATQRVQPGRIANWLGQQAIFGLRRRDPA